jgi:hypothetical protein
MGLRPSEHQEQVAFFQYAKLKALQDKRYENVMAVPNAGKRSVVHGGRMKAEGLSAGFPDIFCFVPNKEYHGLAMEMKVGKNKPTVKQLEWLKRLEAQGYATFIVYSATEAIKVLEDYLPEK